MKELFLALFVVIMCLSAVHAAGCDDAGPIKIAGASK